MKVSTESVDDSNYIDNEIADDSDGNKSEKDDLYYDKEECSMQEYEIMKVNENVQFRTHTLNPIFFLHSRTICFCTTTPD